MTTAKARYQEQIGEFVHEVEFSELELADLKSIRDDENFINAIRHIATLYVCLLKDEAEALNSGEIKATVKDLLADSATLARKLENMPQAVDALLWKLNYKHAAPAIPIAYSAPSSEGAYSLL